MSRLAYNYIYINQSTEKQASMRYDLYTYHFMDIFTDSNTFSLSQEFNLDKLFGCVIICEMWPRCNVN